MSKLLAAILFYATFAAAVTESIQIHGRPDYDMVNQMYQSFGGSWNLSTSGVEGFERAIISHITFHPLGSNDTDHSNSTSVSRVKRRNVGSPDGYNQADRHGLFTVQQQQWIVGSVCSTFSQRTIPFTFTGLAMIIDEVWCKTWTQGAAVCKVVVEMGLTQGSTSFAAAWAQVCVENYAAIENSCGQDGGTVNATTPGGYTFQNGGFQLTTVTFTTTIYASLSPGTSLTTVCPNGGYCSEWTCAAAVCNEGPSV